MRRSSASLQELLRPRNGRAPRASDAAPGVKSGAQSAFRGDVQAAAQARAYGIATAIFVLAFALGGSARADAASLLVLRPLSVLALVWTAVTLTRGDLARHRVLVALGCLTVLLLVAQLIKLPPDLWRQLPGRAIMAEIDRSAGLGNVWRPLSMHPPATRNALWSLALPLALLFALMKLELRALQKLAAIMLVFVMASALLALAQVLGDAQGPLYLYKITNNGSPVGLFANRNHQAVLLACSFPLLAIWATPGSGAVRTGRWRQGAAFAALLFVVPLVLLTGSRAGMLAAVLGIAAGVCLLLARNERRSASRGSMVSGSRGALGVLGAVLSLASISIWLQRDVALDRLLGMAVEDDMRARIVPTALEMMRLYWPWGSGAGAFAEVYQVHEPDALLMPAYMNHAHNDWLEIVLDTGLPGVLLLVAGLFAYAVAVAHLWSAKSRSNDLRTTGLAGASVIALLLLASASDYPLRVPSLVCLFVFSAVLLSAACNPSADHPDHD